MGDIKTLEFKWTVSRGRDTYGYNICTLYADGRKVSQCNGGGYDMEGTCLGNFIASHYADRLLKLTESQFPERTEWQGTFKDGKRVSLGRGFYGLSFHNPNYDPGKAVLKRAPVFGEDKDAGKTVEQCEAEGTSLGLERYQAFHSASSPMPTALHRVPLIDGACGRSSVESIAKAIGLTFEWCKTRSKRITVYQMHDAQKEQVAA